MALEVYRKKRKFGVTSEPRGRKARGHGNRFVIQKHAATRLHYDLRLELDGVMKSWAVTRGPSLDPGEKRLAVEVEDHPVEYNSFEGTIPKGEYGGGTVMIWDRGTWEPEHDPQDALKKGHLDFTLHGEKLHGQWHLVRMRGRPGEKRNNWLLIKASDDDARAAKQSDILEERPESVVSGRSLDEIEAGKGRKRVWHSNRSVKENVKAGAKRGGNGKAPAQKSIGARSTRREKSAKKKATGKAKKSGGAPLPEFVAPSLATLRDTAPSGAGWVHEIKFDGYRTQARLDHGKVQLLTRKGLDWTKRFPNVAADVKRLAADSALIDGEIVIENEIGASDFSMLQAALKNGESKRFLYYVFDLLHLNGEDLSGGPLIERKGALKDLLESTDSNGAIRYSEHFEEDGQVVWAQACRMSLEGIVSKRADAPYLARRSDAFIKVKCANAQEFVVAGYAPSNAMPRAVGALIASYYDNDQLRYAGRIGTGYSQRTAKELWKALHPLERKTAPIVPPPPQERRSNVRWVEPTMVIESHFRGWTGDDLVRQAAFKGVREDKPAKEVVREVAGATGAAAPDSRGGAEASKMAKKSKESKKHKLAGAAKSHAAGKSSKGSQKRQSANEDEGGVRFTHPDRVYWADAGVTKQDLADYYRAVWKWMEPHVAGRPLSFLRCPDGAKGQCFFQKHASAGLSEDHLHSVIDAKRRQVIAIEDLDGLFSLVQAGVLEVHLRGSTIDRLDACDRIVFDIDPGEGVQWPDIARAAKAVRERLEAIDLESFVKLSGGKGVHVVLPVEPVDWERVKTFVQAFAQVMAADEPDRYLAKMTKSLRKGKIFIDYLRNSLEQTSVAVYSTRARDGAPVSAPVNWEELSRIKSASQFTVLNLGKRLASLKRDPWADIGRVKQRLPDFRTLRK